MELPVVATAVDGNVEYVDDAKTGLLVAPQDAHALARAIARLADDTEAAERMGKRARERAQQEFTLDGTLDAYLDLYEETMAEKTGQPAETFRLRTSCNG